MIQTDVTDVTSDDVLNAPLEVLDPAIAAVLRAEVTRPCRPARAAPGTRRRWQRLVRHRPRGLRRDQRGLRRVLRRRPAGAGGRGRRRAAEERARRDRRHRGGGVDGPDRRDARLSVRGQAGLGLELLDDIPDLAHVVVPIGGGGLASGVALAVRLARPDVRITGVGSPASRPRRARHTRRPSASIVELRGGEHADALAKALDAAGYPPRTGA